MLRPFQSCYRFPYPLRQWFRLRWWKRELRFCWNRLIHAQDLLDATDAGHFICEIARDACRNLRLIKRSTPIGVDEIGWSNILQEIEEGFEAGRLLCEAEYTTHAERRALEKRLKAGCSQFAKWAFHMWD